MIFNRQNGYCERIQRMKLVILTLLAVLLGCCCSGGSELYGANEGNKLQFSDLDTDVMYIIINQLELDDLLNLEEVDIKCMALVAEVMRHKYRHGQLNIITQRRDGFPRKKSCEQFDNNQHQLTLHDVPLALRVLKSFGGYFQAIKFSCAFGLTGTKCSNLDKIGQYINEYCSKTVKRLDLDTADDLLKTFSKPFEAAEELSIHSTIDKTYSTIRLNELFPQLRRFDSDAKMNNYGFINGTFPHLQHFSLFSSATFSHHVKEFIQKHPTIQSVDSHTRDPSMIKFISQQLPNLENLTIHEINLFEYVQFERLKHLDWSCRYVNSMDKFSVPRLESLKIGNYIPVDSSKWMQFFRSITQLRRLHVAGSSGLAQRSMFDLNQFTVDLSNLTEITVSIDTEFGSVVAFFENHRQLNKCNFVNFKFKPYQQKILRERLGHEWNIDFHSNGSTFERKPANRSY